MRSHTIMESRIVDASHIALEKRQAEALRVHKELEDAKERELQQAKKLAQHEANRSRQKTGVIRVLSSVLGFALLVGGVWFYREWVFSTSNWRPISKNSFPSSWAYSIAYAKLPGDGVTYLYCTSTLNVGVGCSKNGNTWNFYQQGFGTGLPIVGDSGGLPDSTKGITALAIDSANPTILLAFSDDHFYRSDDTGVTWIAGAQIGRKDSEVFVLEVHDRLAIAVAHRLANRTEVEGGNEALYISTDGGKYWTKEADGDDPVLGKVHDATIDQAKGVVYAATSLGLMQGEQLSERWHWRTVDDLPEARLVAQTHGAGSDLAVVTYDETTLQSSLWLLSATESHMIKQWAGKPLRLAIDPFVGSLSSQGGFRAYVLVNNGDVVMIDSTTGEKQVLDAVAPIGGLVDDILIGESYDLAAVPDPTGTGSWVLTAHRAGLLKYNHP